jgi:hypothetical protein
VVSHQTQNGEYEVFFLQWTGFYFYIFPFSHSSDRAVMVTLFCTVQKARLAQLRLFKYSNMRGSRSFRLLEYILVRTNFEKNQKDFLIKKQSIHSNFKFTNNSFDEKNVKQIKLFLKSQSLRARAYA